MKGNDKPLGIGVAKTNNIIEINGKRYDSVTGAMLIASKSHRPAAAKKPQKNHSQRTVAEPVRPHSPETARTLMRHVVKKPGHSLKRQLRAQAAIDMTTVPATNLSQSIRSLDHRRLSHAKSVNQSNLIKHFSALKADFQPIPAIASQSPIKPAVHQPPVIKAKTTAELLEKALQAADSHDKPPVKNPKRHLRAKAGLAVVGLVAIGLVAISSGGITNLRLHAASSQAGFSASLPAYQPAGYSLGQLSSSSGEVAAQFHSNSSGSGYSLTQKQSNWDSQMLATNFVAPLDASYQTINSDGLAIYVYEQHNATWVDGGVWYIIQGNDNLTTNQLAQLATSL